jgi:hypothetical protein
MRMLACIGGASLVLAAACGGGDDGDATKAERAIKPEAQNRAESIVLKLSDFPDGWRASSPEDGDEQDEESFRKCLGVDYSEFTITGDAESSDFAMGETAEASSEAQIFAREGEAAVALEAFSEGMRSEAINECMQELLAGEVGTEFEVGDVAAGELSFTPPAGVEEARAWQIAIPIEGKSGGESEGVSVTGYIELVFLREGDAIGSVQTVEVLSPFDSEIRDELVDAVAGRMNQ